jgi:hypothetical protein
VAADGSWATGIWAANGSREVCGTRRFDSSGTEQWSVDHTDASVACRQTGALISGASTWVSLNSRGDVGGDANGGGWDGWVKRFDGSGVEDFSWHLDGSGDDAVLAIAESDDGSVYVCGRHSEAIDAGYTHAGGDDSFLLKLDSSGSLLWAAEWGTAGNDGCFDIAFDHWGDVYVSGRSNSDGTSSSGEVAKFDSDGALEWVTPLETDGAALSIARSVVVDGLDVLVHGHTTGSFPGVTGSGQREGFMVRLDLDGTVQ